MQFFTTKEKCRSWKMAVWLRALAALSWVTGLVQAAQSHRKLQLHGIQHPFLALNADGTHINNTHTHK